MAASAGFILAFDWKIFLVCAAIFFALFFTTHYVSLFFVRLPCGLWIPMIVLGQQGAYGMDASHMMEIVCRNGRHDGSCFFPSQGKCGASA